MAADAAYAMPLATALRSLVENNCSQWPLDIHVLYQGIDEETKSKIFGSLPSNSVEITWHSIDPSLLARKYYTPPHISMMTYARLLLSDVVPASATRALYLDCDILVLGSLEPLWNFELDGTVLGAVVDPFDQNSLRRQPDALLAHKVNRYFNAGVLLIDVERWRDEQVAERAFQYLESFPTSDYADQDALNFACDGRWKELARCWNFQWDPTQNTAFTKLGFAIAIAHFVTDIKPWKTGSLNPNARLYERFRSRTRFARTVGQRIENQLARLGHRLLSRSVLLRVMWRHLKRARQARSIRRSETPYQEYSS